MNNTLKAPEFKSEKEEAEWFDNNQEELMFQFQQAAKTAPDERNIDAPWLSAPRHLGIISAQKASRNERQIYHRATLPESN